MTNVINMILNHKEYGNGQLKEFLGDSIVVRFANGSETLPFPQAFEGDLKTLNEDDAKKIEEIRQRWEALAREAEELALKQEKQKKEEKANAATGKKWTVKVADMFKKIIPAKKKEETPAAEAKEEETKTEEVAPADEEKTEE